MTRSSWSHLGFTRGAGMFSAWYASVWARLRWIHMPRWLANTWRHRSRLRSRVLELDRLPLQQGGAHQYGRDYDVLTVSICWHTHLPSPPRTISLPCTSINKSAWCSGNFLFRSGNKYLAWIELYCRSPRICKLKILHAQVKNVNSVFWQAHRASWNFGCLIPTYTLRTVRYHDLPGS